METKRWHRINIVHLRRMNTDINFMHYEIIRLDEAIKTAMMKKFGMVLQLDELEESVLRRYVFALETTAEEELKQIEKEMNQKQLELAKLYEEMIFETKANTEKLNVLGVLQDEMNFLNEVLVAQQRFHDKGEKPFPYDLDKELEKLIVVDKHQKAEIECLEREICTLRMKAKPLQMDVDTVTTDVTKELLPNEDGDVCPEMLETHAYSVRATPDEFIMDRVLKIVKKCFVHAFGDQTNKEQVRRYAQKVARYLGQVAYSFEGKVTERIMDCITESLQDILPKKYMIFVSMQNLKKMFCEILSAFDYERSEVNTDDLISGIFGNALEVLGRQDNPLNKTQFIVEYIFKQLIEVLPLEEFESNETKRALVEVLAREPLIDPRSIGVEPLLTSIIKHAQENLLDGITALPMRRLIESITKDLHVAKPFDAQCSIGSVASVKILDKKKSLSVTMSK